MQELSRRQVAIFAMMLAVGIVSMAGTYAALASPPPAEMPFMAENRAAMDRMMSGMEIEPSGNVDQDFAAMMIPHHQGAIDMAQAELRHGHNEQLRRIAQEIIVEQQQEIVAMRLALGQKPAPSAAAPSSGPVAMGMHGSHQ
jgi:uncharacterized protein (DUF305 family)